MNDQQPDAERHRSAASYEALVAIMDDPATTRCERRTAMALVGEDFLHDVVQGFPHPSEVASNALTALHAQLTHRAAELTALAAIYGAAAASQTQQN